MAISNELDCGQTMLSQLVFIIALRRKHTNRCLIWLKHIYVPSLRVYEVEL